MFGSVFDFLCEDSGTSVISLDVDHLLSLVHVHAVTWVH